MAWLSSLWHRVPLPPRRRRLPPPRLLALPDDVLFEIVRHVTHTRANATQPATVERASLRAARGLALSCRRLCALVFLSLDSVSLCHPRVDDAAIRAIARRAAPVLRRVVLRGCVSLTNAALAALAVHAPRLRSLDLSFVPAVDDHAVADLVTAAAPRLLKLLLRKCRGVSDRTLAAVAACPALQTLDISFCPRVTDVGIFHVATACGPSLRLLALAYDDALTDLAFTMLGKHCTRLQQLCARGLPYLTDVGFVQLCAGVGHTVLGIDVTDCVSLTRDATLRAFRLYCTKIQPNIVPGFSSRSLRQIIISTLRQNIFIVHGTDPVTRKETVHTVLIDNGDIVSASLLSSGTTDLSMLGIVLCKSFGSGLNAQNKKMLEKDYGIPSSSLVD